MFTYVRRFALLFILIGIVLTFYFCGGFELLRWENIRAVYGQLLAYVEIHPFYAFLLFFGVYIIYTISAIPGLLLLDLLAGFLFGRIFGIFLVLGGATSGALLLFLAARYAFSDFFQKRTQRWIVRLRQGFDRNQKSYLIFLRIVPFFPFGIINVALALLNIRTWTYCWTTMVGILPIGFLHVHVGSSLGKLLENDTLITPASIFSYEVILALIALAGLTILPIAFRKKS